MPIATGPRIMTERALPSRRSGGRGVTVVPHSACAAPSTR